MWEVTESLVFGDGHCYVSGKGENEVVQAHQLPLIHYLPEGKKRQGKKKPSYTRHEVITVFFDAAILRF